MPACPKGKKRYVITGPKLGQGLSGSVYRAFDRMLNKPAAVKIAAAATPRDTLYLKREFRILAPIEHRNLVQFYDLFVTSRRCFFTMELVWGKSFFETAWGQAGFTPSGINYSCVRRTLQQLSASLHTLHGHGIVHRDIKPANIVIGPGGRAVLLDFSLARCLWDHTGHGFGDTGVSGTFAYMAPEVMAGQGANPCSDWYSLGAVLYECLTGRLPLAIEGFPLPPPKSIVKTTPDDLNELTLTLLSSKPEKRVRPTVYVTQMMPATGIRESDRAYGTAPAAQGIGTGYRPAAFFLKTLKQSRRCGHRAVLAAGSESSDNTAVVRHFINKASRDLGALVFASQYSPREHLRFNAIDGIVDQLSLYLESRKSRFPAVVSPQQRHLLCQQFPVLALIDREKREACTPPSYCTGTNIHGLGHILKELMHTLAQKVPMIVWVDGFDRADPESVHLIGEMLSASRLRGILFILTCQQMENRPSAMLHQLIRDGKIGSEVLTVWRPDV